MAWLTLEAALQICEQAEHNINSAETHLLILDEFVGMRKVGPRPSALMLATALGTRTGLARAYTTVHSVNYSYGGLIKHTIWAGTPWGDFIRAAQANIFGGPARMEIPIRAAKANLIPGRPLREFPYERAQQRYLVGCSYGNPHARKEGKYENRYPS